MKMLLQLSLSLGLFPPWEIKLLNHFAIFAIWLREKTGVLPVPTYSFLGSGQSQTRLGQKYFLGKFCYVAF